MYQRHAKGWAKHLDFIIIDCLCLTVAFFLAYFIRHGSCNPFVNAYYRDIFFASISLNFVVILFLDTMKNVLKRGSWKEITATLWQALLLLFSISTYMFLCKTGESYSRITIFLMIVIYTLVTYLVRLVWKYILKRFLKNKTANALLIIAGPEKAAVLIKEVAGNNYGRNKIVGLVGGNKELIGTQVEGIPYVAASDSVIEYVTKNWVDEVLISIDGEESYPDDIVDTLTLMGVVVHITLDKSSQHLGVKQVIGNIGGLLVISSSMNYITPRQAIVKRALDIAGGIVGCILTGIIYLFVAPAIKRESPGPVFFTQTRIGKNGKPFKFYKFRSMYLDAEKRKAELLKQNRIGSDLMFKMDFDPRVIGNHIDENGNRITGIGEFIRKYSLDEFPQFFNVLKGDMSLVGTRPPLVDEYNAYSAHHKARLATKPGITGLWQVSGRSDILDFEEVVKLDTQYINNWSLGLDLKILFKTILVVLKKEGSM